MPFRALTLQTFDKFVFAVLLRKKMDDIARLSDVVLPVLHEVLQRYQWVFYYWHHVFRGPGLHGNQYNPCVELFLVDLVTKYAKYVHQSTALFPYTWAVNILVM